jgi:DNA (cytosine-5)-methyltransferase 1
VNYYNENDPKAAAWLRELMRAGEIPHGVVDERSIVDVNADELSEFIQCHFFAGIGGWSLALKLAGWPEDRKVWTGSCPCQPFSQAGRQLQEADERHLFPDFRNLIGQRRPPTIFGEQVASAAGREWLAGVSTNLETLAYRFAAADLCAASVGAPHIRQRIYWVADTELHAGKSRRLANESRESFGKKETRSSTEPGRCGVSGSMANSDECSNIESITQFEQPSGTVGIQENPERLAYSKFSRRKRFEFTRRSSPTGQIDGGSLAGGLGNAKHTARPRFGFHGGQMVSQNEKSNGRYDSNSWSRFDILPCADGKSRRIESGTFPLAHGISGRVGLLRGYGNAIVPELAEKFIKAYCETKNLK